MKYCVNCGAEMDDEADFCVHCGKRAERTGPFYNAPKFKYCTHCGAELKEGADVCLSCGRRVGRPFCPPPPPAKTNVNNVLAIIAKVFMILSCASSGIVGLYCLLFGGLCFIDGATAYVEYMGDSYAADSYGAGIVFIVMAISSLISLAWKIPFTVHVFRKAKEHAPISTAAKVCILIFVNMVAGILLLCMKEPEAPRPMGDGDFPPPPPQM